MTTAQCSLYAWQNQSFSFFQHNVEYSVNLVLYSLFFILYSLFLFFTRPALKWTLKMGQFTMLSPIWESLGSLFLVFTKLNALLSSSSWSGFHLNRQDKSTLKLYRSTYECCRLSTYEYCRLRGNSPALNVVRGFKLSTYECCRLRHPDQDQALGIQAQPTGPELGRNIYHGRWTLR